MKRALPFLILVDAAVLLLLGASFIFLPGRIVQAFHFPEAAAGFNYLIGLWGCALLTLAAGYAIAATDPWRYRLWIQIAIARGALEAVFGLVCIARGIATFAEAGLGTSAAAAICVAYVILYPKKPSGA